MKLSDRFQKPTTSSSPYTCPYYLQGEDKRCQYYLEGGACAREEVFMCYEWLRANGHPVPKFEPRVPEQPEQAVTPFSDAPASVPVTNGAFPASEKAPPPSAAVPTDLFGHPLPEEKQTAPVAKPLVQQGADGPTPLTLPPLAASLLTPEGKEYFKQRKVEFCFRSPELGELWLVPKLTQKTRQELTVDDLVAFCLLLEAFPGAKLIALDFCRSDSLNPTGGSHEPQ